MTKAAKTQLPNRCRTPSRFTVDAKKHPLEGLPASLRTPRRPHSGRAAIPQPSKRENPVQIDIVEVLDELESFELVDVVEPLSAAEMGCLSCS
ncbi:MAG: hypothetical protein JSR59_22170 [Proteobacteria bacterium]|nr:hypothetical protein [Pseudomonadota bacterium]